MPSTEKPYFAIRETQNPRSRPTHEEIAVRAYKLYLERGGAGGNDVSDWMQAEQELLENLPKNVSSRGLDSAKSLHNRNAVPGCHLARAAALD